MSTKTPAVAGPASNSSGHGEREAGGNPAHDGDSANSNQTTAYVLENSVIVEKPEYVRVEAPRETFYRDPLDPTTRQAVAEVAICGG